MQYPENDYKRDFKVTVWESQTGDIITAEPVNIDVGGRTLTLYDAGRNNRIVASYSNGYFDKYLVEHREGTKDDELVVTTVSSKDA